MKVPREWDELRPNTRSGGREFARQSWGVRATSALALSPCLIPCDKCLEESEDYLAVACPEDVPSSTLEVLIAVSLDGIPVGYGWCDGRQRFGP